MSTYFSCQKFSILTSHKPVMGSCVCHNKGNEFLPQTQNVISKSPSLKCRRFTSSDCKDIGIRKPKFVVKTRFLDRQTKFIYECYLKTEILNFNARSRINIY